MSKPKPPPCQFCGSANTKFEGGYICCRACGETGDGNKDEGGDYSDRNPAARLERAERRREGRRR